MTDMAKIRDAENPLQIIGLWLCTYSTIEYIGLWEMMNNPNFNPHIYEGGVKTNRQNLISEYHLKSGSVKQMPIRILPLNLRMDFGDHCC